MKSRVFKAIALIAVLGTPASAKTYNVAEIAADFAVSGSIVTDGTIGALTTANILDWNLTVAFFTHPGVAHFTGPSFGIAHNLFGITNGANVTADNFGLYFNFSFGRGEMRWDFDQAPFAALDFEANTGGTGTLLAVFNPGSGQLPHVEMHPIGILQFAIDPTPFDDNVPTPLPAALPLFAGGLGLIGLLARRRKKKRAALAA